MKGPDLVGMIEYYEISLGLGLFAMMEIEARKKLRFNTKEDQSTTEIHESASSRRRGILPISLTVSTRFYDIRPNPPIEQAKRPNMSERYGTDISSAHNARRARPNTREDKTMARILIATGLSALGDPQVHM